MANSVQIPQKLIDYLQDPNKVWAIGDGSLEYDTMVASTTGVLQDVVEPSEIIVGIKSADNTYIYEPLNDIAYDEASDVFNINVGRTDSTKSVVLIPLDRNTDNITSELNESKMVHLFKGFQGEVGKSAYQYWKDNTVSEDKTLEYYVGRLEVAIQLAAELEALTKRHNQLYAYVKQLELPIGTLMYSHNNPDSNLWLPFDSGDEDKIYNDADYPELAQIVKSWGDTFKVTDTSFRLGDIAALNRYLCAAGGSRPAGTLIASQLPNITGDATRIAETFGSYGTASGAFAKSANISAAGTPEYADSSPCGGFTFDASRSSTVYKSDVTNVMPDTLAMNLYIKAKNLVS